MTGVSWLQSATLNRPYRTSPDQVVSVGRAVPGLTATGKAVPDRSASSSGAGISASAAGSKASGGSGSMANIGSGKLSTPTGAVKR